MLVYAVVGVVLWPYIVHRLAHIAKDDDGRLDPLGCVAVGLYSVVLAVFWLPLAVLGGIGWIGGRSA